MADSTVVTGDIVTAPTGRAIAASTGQLIDLVEAWLSNRNLSVHTRDAYRRDVHLWISWCTSRRLDPLTVKFTHINTFGRWLTAAPEHIDEQPYVKRPAAESTAARRLSAVSSWYAFLLKLNMIAANPAAGVDRPSVDRDHSTTAAFSAAHATAMMDAAPHDPILGTWCGPAVLAFLTQLGARVGELCAARIADRGYDQGHHTINLRMKGRKRRVRSLPPGLYLALEAYLHQRAAATGTTVDQLTGHLFVRPDGRPLDRATVARYVRRVAVAAGLPHGNRISPHSFRHAFSRIARAAGATLEERQDALGHADPRTTRRYDKAEVRLARDPSHLVYAATAQPADQH